MSLVPIQERTLTKYQSQTTDDIIGQIIEQKTLDLLSSYCWCCTVTMTSWLLPIGIRMGAIPDPPPGTDIAVETDVRGKRPVVVLAAPLLPPAGPTLAVLARPT